MVNNNTKKFAKELQFALNQFRRHKLENGGSCLGDINRAQLFVLMLIQNMGEEVTSTKIAKRMCITMGAVTHNIKELEDLGFIKKKVSLTDRRVFYIELTEKGKKYLKKIEQTQYKQMVVLIDTLGVEDSSKLLEIISKLNKIPFK